jgi:hypothetical protein
VTALPTRVKLMTTRTAPGSALIAPGLVVAVPFVLYLIPFLTGYGWSAIGPLTPGFPGMTTSPERLPAVTTAVEHYGTGVVVVPFQARLRAYLRDHELPLWNPYSGLGHPFAAQGEGSPYFPMAVIRSLVPTSWSNAVTFVMIGISSVTMVFFLRLLGLSPASAAFGGAAWSLSGVFTLNVARNNYVDQFAMIPPLFLAAAWAIASHRATAYVAFAFVVGLHGLAGLLQIGVNTLLLLTGFLVFFSYLRAASMTGRLTTIVASFLFLGLGTALAAPYVLPIIEAVRAAFNKNVPNLAFLAMPSANVVAFFFPLVFGQIFQTWIAGRSPSVVDWNNLYAHGSTGLLLLAVLASVALPRDRRDQRLAYLFFAGGLIFFHSRYMSLPPGSLVSYLPILNQQSPKHTNGLAAFCLVVAACFGVEWLRCVNRRRALWLLAAVLLGLAASILVLVRRQGGLAAVDVSMALVHLSVTMVIILMLLTAFGLAHRASTDTQAALIATAAVIGESSIYLLLGNDALGILAVRIGIGGLVVLTGVLVAQGARLPATVAGLVAVAAYAWVVIWPTNGLPKRVEIDAPPRYMTWLRETAGQEYRSFGIYPDYSSVGEIQDTEAVGPLATNEWVAFVDLVGSPVAARTHRFGSTFALGMLYDLTTDYPRARPLFDWVGMRYLVLDKTVFDGRPRRDHEPLLAPSSGLRIAYEDEAVTILESPTAQSKAFFTTRVREVSMATTLAMLRADPWAIEGPVTVESDVGDVGRGDEYGPSFPVPLAEYRPNDLRATFEAPAPGIFVVKDSFFPGWQATLNGRPAEILEVNGLVRGVVVPAAGRNEVTMSYRPTSFVNGIAIGAATLALLLGLLAWELAHRRRVRVSHVRRFSMRPSGGGRCPCHPARAGRDCSAASPAPGDEQGGPEKRQEDGELRQVVDLTPRIRAPRHHDERADEPGRK